MPGKILFLVPFPQKVSPSQRFRFEQYFETLRQAGYDYRLQSFLNSHNWQVFFKPGRPFQKLFALFTGFCKRILILFNLRKYDYVFIHREAAPIGPPVFEWIIKSLLRKKMIYDFDDAIWMTDNSSESSVQALIKCRWKVSKICRWAYKVSCGNDFLQAFALQHNPNSFVNPTTIDLNHHIIKNKIASNKITIGWTGSHSTLKYLLLIEPVLKQIQTNFPFVTIRVIADRPPMLSMQNIEFIQWRAESEIQDLAQIDIGLMPLPDDLWSRGKCGFKILQYFALGIPAIASPVGVNAKIVEHGVNGFLCRTESEWQEAIENLIQNKKLREALGQQGYRTVTQNFSSRANSPLFLSFFV